jgi:pimeloyl-ACP methyl ester carboxylesterase
MEVQMRRNDLVTFSCDGWPMHGIVHIPQEKRQRHLGVIILQGNINSSPKFGPHWMFRRLGDALADVGFYAFRYDDRGTCDSPGDCALSFRDRIADLCAASKFLRQQYRLDEVIFWGHCMGAAVAVHAAARLERDEKPDGMILCSLIAQADDVTMPDLGYGPTTFSGLLRSSRSRIWLNKIRRLLTDDSYRRRASAWLRATAGGYMRTNTGLKQLQADVGKVGGILARYDRPILLIFGEKDPFLISFNKYVNAGDKLGLNCGASLAAMAVMHDGDHVFASRQLMRELIEATLEWVRALCTSNTRTSSFLRGEY